MQVSTAIGQELWGEPLNRRQLLFGLYAPKQEPPAFLCVRANASRWNWRSLLFTTSMITVFGFLLPTANAQSDEWTWMGGSSAPNGEVPGVYGTLGQPAAANLPG